MDFPRFEGKDPRGWVNQCEKFFLLNPYMESKTKVVYATLHLEGDADIWFQTIQNEHPAILWEQFIELLYQRFSKGGYENIIGQFNKLTRKGRVEEYICQFEELRKYLISVDGSHKENYYVDSFLSGLKEEISSALYLNKPITLRDARDKARRQESLIEVMDRRNRNYRKMGSSSSPTKMFSLGVKVQNAIVKEVTNKPLPVGVKKLTYTEMTERRNNGLCFNCDEKFSAGHVCKSKQIFMITIEEETGGCEEEETKVIWDVEEDCNPWGINNKDNDVAADLSLHAISWTQGLHTIKVRGSIKNRQVSLLLDSGSSHSFISSALVKQLRLNPSPFSEVGVTVANGEKIPCNQVVEGVKWYMSNKLFSSNFHVINLGSYDMIFGINWMKRFSPDIFDFETNSISIKWKGERVELNDQVGTEKNKIITCQTLSDSVGGYSYFLCHVVAKEVVTDRGEGENQGEGLPDGVRGLLHQYQDLFAEPTDLPPTRTHDHLIPLKEGSSPVSSNPYRCPYIQKK